MQCICKSYFPYKQWQFLVLEILFSAETLLFKIGPLMAQWKYWKKVPGHQRAPAVPVQQSV